eukprot:2551329-Alexandrium_andersonii.AAC.1
MARLLPSLRSKFPWQLALGMAKNGLIPSKLHMLVSAAPMEIVPTLLRTLMLAMVRIVPVLQPKLPWLLALGMAENSLTLSKLHRLVTAASREIAPIGAQSI